MPLQSSLHYLYFEGGNPIHPIPVILIHGNGQEASLWPPVLRRLEGYRVFAVDLPGHGRSPGTGLHSVETYAQAITEFMATMRLPRACLVGTSLGGAVALYLGLEYPGLVRAIGLISSGPCVSLPAPWLEALESPLLRAEALRSLEGHLLLATTPRSIAHLVLQTLAHQRPEVRSADWKALARFDVRERLSTLRVPTWAIFGAHDPLVPPALVRQLRRSAPGWLQVEIVPDSSHWVWLEQPEMVSRRLRAFLARAMTPSETPAWLPYPKDAEALDSREESA